MEARATALKRFNAKNNKWAAITKPEKGEAEAESPLQTQAAIEFQTECEITHATEYAP